MEMGRSEKKMKKEQFEKLNNLFAWVAKLEKALDIEHKNISISEYITDDNENELIIDREVVVPLLFECIAQLKAELKELGYEEQ